MLGSEKKPLYYVVVLLLGSLIAWLIATGKPEPAIKASDEPKDVDVDVALFDVASHRVWLKSQGLVTAETSSVLSAQVAGRIKQIDNAFVVGGSFEAGQVLLSLEEVLMNHSSTHKLSDDLRRISLHLLLIHEK